MARAINMGVMTVIGLIFNMSRRNRNAAGALFRGFVNLVKSYNFTAAVSVVLP